MLLLYFILLPLLCFCKQDQKNIVLFLTDDQDLLLNSLLPMKYTRKMIANKGVTLRNAFVTTPICCPSRSSILTGLYSHNHGTTNNSISGGCSGVQWQEIFEKNTFATELKSVGYKTFYAGKYLNQYGTKNAGGAKHIPEGWDWWYGLVGNSKYYNYTLSVNGSKEYFQNEYLTDQITKYSLEFLNQKYISDGNPFLMVLSTPAPHAPFIPALRHQNLYPNVKVKWTPAFNFTTGTSKHWIMRMPPNPLPESAEPVLSEIQRKRWQTLVAVDEMVRDVITKLNSLKVMQNTYVIFTSDNGFHLGQFCQAWDKRQPYDTDIRVPFLLRGPGLPKKYFSDYPVSNIDIAPAIKEMGGIKHFNNVDGNSFLKALINKKKGSNWLTLIEYHGEHNIKSVSKNCHWQDPNLAQCSEMFWCKCQDAINNTFTCIRQMKTTENFLYCEFIDDEKFVEAYNLIKDPYQLDNIAYKIPRDIHQEFHNKLKILTVCKGTYCKIR